MLFCFGEHHAVHLGAGARTNQRNVLVYLRQAAAKRADRPLQRCVLIDHRFVVGEMPNPFAPVLEIHVAELRAGADKYFNRSAMQAGCVVVRPGRFRKHRRLGPFVQHEQNVAEVDSARRENRKLMERLFKDHPFRYV